LIVPHDDSDANSLKGNGLQPKNRDMVLAIP
jgi:hypothetical protein